MSRNGHFMTIDVLAFLVYTCKPKNRKGDPKGGLIPIPDGKPIEH